MGGFGQKKGKGKMMYLYNNEIKNKNIRQLNQLTQNIFEKDC